MILLKTKLGQHVSTLLGPGNQPLYDALADLPVEKQKINKLINFWCYRSLQTWEHWINKIGRFTVRIFCVWKVMWASFLAIKVRDFYEPSTVKPRFNNRVFYKLSRLSELYFSHWTKNYLCFTLAVQTVGIGWKEDTQHIGFDGRHCIWLQNMVTFLL